MSFLAIDEIRGKTSGTPTDVNNLKYQLATAWVNFNGTGTVAIRDSYNVSSITDNGVGHYTINFNTAMDVTDYSFSGSASTLGGGNGYPLTLNPISISLTSFTVKSAYEDGTGEAVADRDFCSAIFCGGKT